MKKFKILILLLSLCMITFLIKTLVYDVLASETVIANVNSKDTSEYVVVLDAGHGGDDSGSTTYDESYLEKDIVLEITLQLGEMLEAEGINVVYTRDGDVVADSDNNKKDLANRVAISNANNTALYLSIHLNYYESGDVSGFETWVDSTDQKALAFAQEIQNQLSILGYSEDRGIKDENESTLYVIENNKATSALVELGFITSQNDLTYLLSEDGSTCIANALKSSIISYLSIYSN